jgi:hypothetical protein
LGRENLLPVPMANFRKVKIALQSWASKTFYLNFYFIFIRGANSKLVYPRGYKQQFRNLLPPAQSI